MNLDNYKLKLNKTKDFINTGFPQYTISYKAASKKPGYVSYAILSALREDSDVVIEVNTDFFSGIGNKDNYITEFLNKIRLYDLDYCHRKVPSTQRPSLFGIPLGEKKVAEAHEIAVYVPAKIWVKESFSDILPAYGARYYITRASMCGEEIVNSIWSISEEKKANNFKLILFNLALAGRMGITSNYLGEEDLSKLIGLKH